MIGKQLKKETGVCKNQFKFMLRFNHGSHIPLVKAKFRDIAAGSISYSLFLDEFGKAYDKVPRKNTMFFSPKKKGTKGAYIGVSKGIKAVVTSIRTLG